MPAVTELLIAEMLYLQHRDSTKPVNIYINSTGTTRADGETVRSNRPCPLLQLKLYLIATFILMIPVQVGFETEGTAVYDAIGFLSNPVCISLTSFLQCRLSCQYKLTWKVFWYWVKERML